MIHRDLKPDLAPWAKVRNPCDDPEDPELPLFAGLVIPAGGAA